MREKLRFGPSVDSAPLGRGSYLLFVDFLRYSRARDLARHARGAIELRHNADCARREKRARLVLVLIQPGRWQPAVVKCHGMGSVRS